jgi:hypothetical protein
MTDLRKAAEQALKDLESAEVTGNCYYKGTELLRTCLAQPVQSVAGYCNKIEELIAERDSLRAALAQPEQEPRNIRERWNIEFDGDDLLVCFNHHEKSEGCRYERYVPATTTPTQRKPLVWLSEEEERQIKDHCTTVACVLRAVKAKLKEKNND